MDVRTWMLVISHVPKVRETLRNTQEIGKKRFHSDMEYFKLFKASFKCYNNFHIDRYHCIYSTKSSHSTMGKWEYLYCKQSNNSITYIIRIERSWCEKCRYITTKSRHFTVVKHTYGHAWRELLRMSPFLVLHTSTKARRKISVCVSLSADD